MAIASAVLFQAIFLESSITKLFGGIDRGTVGAG